MVYGGDISGKGGHPTGVIQRRQGNGAWATFYEQKPPRPDEATAQKIIDGLNARDDGFEYRLTGESE